MKKLMWESPQEVDTINDHHLEDQSYNKSLVKFFITSPHKHVWREDDYSALVEVPGKTKGSIGMIDKSSGELDYLVDYETIHLPGIGNAMCQVLLWRRAGSHVAKGITTEIFFERLLPHHGTIVSDAIQSKSGKRFWIDRMGDAVLKGYRVGMYNTHTHDVIWFDNKQHGIDHWVNDVSKGYGKSQEYQKFRYIITK